ncbi:MAG: hypothetical protein ACFFE2_16180 [Candidatus Thorarchaeota archaeon]
MEGVSGEGIKRHRREYREEVDETKVEDLESVELMRARELALDASETDQVAEVSAREIVEQVVKEVNEEREREEEISQKLDEVLEDLEKMEKSNESTEEKLRKALEELDDQERREVIDDSSEEQYEQKESRFGEISTKEEYDNAVENHSEMKLRKSYEKDETEASEYFEKLDRGEDVEKPSIVEEVESRELRRMYESVHDGLPEAQIESMKDVDDLLEKYPEERERAGFDENYRRCEVYYEVRDEHSTKRDDLAEQHDVSHTFIGYCRNGIEPNLIKRLREHEEERIMEEWTKDSPQIEDIERIRKSVTQEVGDREEAIKQIEPHKVRESIEKMWESDRLSSERVASAVEHMLRDESSEKHPVRYADFKSEIDSKQNTELKRFIDSNRQEIEESLTQKLGLEHNRARVAYVDDRMYTWIPKNRSDELVSAYETEFYYFRDNKEITCIVNELQRQFGLEESPHKSLKHMNEVVKQFHAGDDGTSARKRPISEKSTRLEGKIVRFYLDSTDRKLSNLEGRVTKVTGVNGQAGIENPRFPEGEELEVLKARLAAIIVSDCHLRESGRITYNEEHLERIDRVQDILSNFGDITLRPKLRPGSYEVHIQNQIGLIMIHEGMTPGNKTITNPSLPEGYLNWSEEARCAYLEELIPEDGGFDSTGYFYWSRNVALYIKDEQNKFGFQSKVGASEISLVKESGGQTEDLVKQSWISYTALSQLQKSDNSEVASAAKNLVSAVDANRSNLVDDESAVAESLGIKITVRPDLIRYYPTGEKVSVRWRATTSSKEDTVQWVKICPPNDERKRSKAESWFRETIES